MTRKEAALKMVVEQLPDFIRIGPFDYAIKKWSAGEMLSAGRYGEHSAVDLEICIGSDFASPVKAVDTLLHEIGHAIFFAYTIDPGEDPEEKVVGKQATAWTQIYRDNPWLLSWIARGVS